MIINIDENWSIKWSQDKHIPEKKKTSYQYLGYFILYLTKNHIIRDEIESPNIKTKTVLTCNVKDSEKKSCILQSLYTPACKSYINTTKDGYILTRTISPSLKLLALSQNLKAVL